MPTDPVTQAAGSRDTTAPRGRWWRWGITALLALLIGVALVLWKPARVRGNSMWPTLQGDRDWILVERSLFATPCPERFEIWVFDEPEEEGVAGGLSGPSVKRVVARSGEWIDFRAGDLFVGADAERLERAPRSPELVDAMLVPVFALDAGGPQRMAEGFRLESGSWSGGHPVRLATDPGGAGAPFRAVFHAGSRQRPDGVWDDHIEPKGRPEAGRHRVPDLRIDIQILELSPRGAITARHAAHAQESREITLREGGGLEIRALDPGSASELLARFPDLQPPLTLRLQTIDGRFGVWRLGGDGRPARPALYEGARDTLALAAWQPKTQSFKTDSQVLLEMSSGWARLGVLDIARDVYYFWPHGLRSAYQVGTEQLFLVGDNPPASRDSRDYLAVSEDRLVGKIFRRFWPRWGVVR